jgi:hypothetical protein
VRDLADRLDALAKLLEYPCDGHTAHVALCAAVVTSQDPEAVADLAPLVELSSSNLGDCEERYVRTFDGNAERALEVGWQVFGEQYERGALLADRAVLRSVDRVIANMDPTDPYRGVMTAVRRALGAFETTATPIGGKS